MSVVDADAGADRADERRTELGVEAIAHEHLDAGLAQRDHGTFELPGQSIDIGLRSQAVIAAGAQADQVGSDLQRAGDLFVDDAVEQPTSDREIGIGDVRAAHRGLREHEAQAVGPTTVAVLPMRVGIHQPLAERVSDSDV
jgi:hypothetical protein